MKRRDFLGLLGGGLAYTQAWGRSLPRQLPSMRGSYARGPGMAEYPELWRGLVGWWPFGMQGSGNTTYDFSGHGNEGTFTGGPVWAPGKFGRTLLFDGSNHVDAGDIPLDSDNWTISGWFTRKTGSGHKRIVSWHGAGPTIRYSDDGNDINIVHSGLVDLTATDVQPGIDVHAHIAITRKGFTARIFVDGVVVEESTTFNKTYTADSSARIANSTAFDEPFFGLIDDVQFRNISLEPAEVRLLYEIPYAPGVRRRRIFAVKQGIVPPVPPGTRIWGSNTD